MSNTERQVLSQEELNLLLQGVAPDVPGSADIKGTSYYEAEGPSLSDADRQTLARIVDISMKKAAESLSLLIKKPAVSDFPTISETTWDNIVKDGIVSSERIVTTVSFIEGLGHDNLMAIKIEDAKAIVDLMLGGNGRVTNGELDDLKMSAVGEAMNQMMGTSATALAEIFDKKVIISTPQIKIVNAEEQILSTNKKERMVLVRIVFTMTLDEPVSSEFYQIIPVSNALEMIKKAINYGALPDQAPEPVKPKVVRQEQTERALPAKQELPERPIPAKLEAVERTVPAQPVQFRPLEASDSMKSTLVKQLDYSKLELLYDVPLQFVVELGRTDKTLQEVLELGPGSVIGLEKLAGESLDVLVNGKFIAKGEVIVIDENYGVRIKEVITHEERLGSIKNRI